VVIPTYNHAHLIGRAIRSVLSQSFQDFELIIVDDGSTDNTEKVVEGFPDERLRYIRHDKNRGACAAMNTGIREARGDFIAFLDADNEWFPEKLEKQVTAFSKLPPEFGVVYTSWWGIKGTDKYYGPTRKTKSGDIHRDILAIETVIDTSSVLVKKECFEKAALFDERLHHRMDWELFIRISRYYYFYHVNEPLFNYYVLAGSMSADSERRLIAAEEILQMHSQDFNQDRRVLSKCLKHLGYEFCSSSAMGQGKKYFLRAIKAYPFDFQLLVATLLSFLGRGVYGKVAQIRRKIC